MCLLSEWGEGMKMRVKKTVLHDCLECPSIDATLQNFQCAEFVCKRQEKDNFGRRTLMYATRGKVFRFLIGVLCRTMR